MSPDSDDIAVSRPPAAGGSRCGGGAGNHRLSALDRRVGVLENKIDEVKEICIRIETKMDSLASKSYVSWFAVGIVLAALLAIFGHVLIRNLSS